jgi:flagellar basal-body rod modification protein FlgD
MTTTSINNGVSSSVLDSLQKTTSSTDSSTGAAGSALGKDAFLQLLVTQMQNQNPLDPQDNGEFVAQLAQFSSLESMQSLNSSVGTIVNNYQSSQALQASSLVGRSVIAQTDSAVVDTTKGLTGSTSIWAASRPAMPALPGTARTAMAPLPLPVPTPSRLRQPSTVPPRP